jgi:hypothetical protein
LLLEVVEDGVLAQLLCRECQYDVCAIDSDTREREREKERRTLSS